MSKKILFCSVLSAALMFLTSCSVKTIEKPNENITTTDFNTTTIEISTEESTTEESTTCETTIQTETSEAVTESTTKKKNVVTTTKVPTTIKNNEISKPDLITTKVSTGDFSGDNYVTQTHTENLELRYSVLVSRSLEITYEILSDGSKKEVKRETTAEVFNRTFYYAKYEDLLVYAKKDKDKYSAYIQYILERTNQMRAEKGVAPLKLDSKLTEQACCRAEEIAWSGKHSHYRPGGNYFSSMFKDNGYTKGNVGENIGWYYEDPEKVCDAWRDSETHYENIINPVFKSIGIGVAAECDSTKGLCWVQHFYSE